VRAAKIDVTQRAIVDALRKAGATVQHLHTVGDGCPDLAVGFRGVNYMIEVKPNVGSPSRRNLRPNQQEWHDGWKGQSAVASTPEAALIIIGHTIIPLRGVIS